MRCPQSIVQVDAFTNRPFHGNPAAVCVMESQADEQWMQNVAAEMNLAETAFLFPQADGSYQLRWFTPRLEVELCGHATLASAHVLYESGRLPKSHVARFHTRSGLLTARLAEDWIELDFPATPAREVPPPPELVAALSAMGARPFDVRKSTFDYLVELESERAVRALEPDFAALKKVPARGVIVTARCGPESPFDFVSRFFAPQCGIDEDPVTGSAHCALGPYWMERLARNPLTAFQASRRGGEVRVEVKGDRIALCGKAVTVLHGELIS